MEGDPLDFRDGIDHEINHEIIKGLERA